VNTFTRYAVTATLAGVAIGVALAMVAARYRGGATTHEPPATLRETGLYADWERKIVAPFHRAFAPQYPLWTDGARKQRWIHLPAGTSIDASDPDAWQFPIGTRLWKEFSFGARTETRYMVRTREGWRFATYVWSSDEIEATRVEAGTTVAHEVAPGRPHQVPSEGECRACHGNAPTPVLGFSALQLSPERDPNAPHREEIAPGSLDLAELVRAGTLRGWPAPAPVPRIPGNPVERAALGYLHGNCGHCHRGDGPVASVGMLLAAEVDAPPSLDTIAAPSKFMAPRLRVAPGDASGSVLLARMRSRSPIEQMPPLGTQLVDEEAARLIARWIDQLATQRGESP
jgi:hypothetical protein